MSNLEIIFPYPTERVAIFVDGANLNSASQKLGFYVNFDKLLGLFRARAYVVRSYFYSAIRTEEDGTARLKPVLDYLSYNNWIVVTKPAKVFTSADGSERIKGNMDIEMTVDILKAAKNVNHVVLFSGDGDFVPLVKAVQEQGVRITAISTYRSVPPVCADELRKAVDHYIDLTDIRSDIEKEKRDAA